MSTTDSRDIITKVPTYQATIWMGLKRGYHGEMYPVHMVQGFCQDYVNRIKLCVTVSPTHFFYVNGEEPGVAIGLINYPRFPKPPAAIKSQAIDLAKAMRVRFGQMRVTVVCTDETILIADPEAEQHV